MVGLRRLSTDAQRAQASIVCSAKTSVQRAYGIHHENSGNVARNAAARDPCCQAAVLLFGRQPGHVEDRPPDQAIPEASPYADLEELVASQISVSTVCSRGLSSGMMRNESSAISSMMRNESSVEASVDLSRIDISTFTIRSTNISGTRNLVDRNDANADPYEQDLQQLWLTRSVPVCGVAQPQSIKVNGQWRDIWPHEWGITISQFKDILDEAKADKIRVWSPETTVTTLVHDYILPRTAKKGVGYAVLVNKDQPKEVNIMVSHAWTESAELFYSRLERSVSATDVMFICAFALYQNEDSYGPTILQQLGDSAAGSPFWKVLAHIHYKGIKQGCLWRYYNFIHDIPFYMFAMALTIFAVVVVHSSCVPVVATDTCIAMKVERSHKLMNYLGGDVDWQLLPWPTEAAGVFWVINACGIFGFLVEILIMLTKPYKGYMLAVPNRNCDIYTRLWCVYEIFVATQLGVPVRLAQTFVQAGKACKSPAREAVCYSQLDYDRIRKEMEAWGELVAQGKQEGYDMVDKAICSTMRRGRSRVGSSIVRFFWPYSMFNIIRSAVLRDSYSQPFVNVACGMGLFIGGIICTGFAGHIVMKSQGRPKLKDVLLLSVSLCVVGGLGAFLLQSAADAFTPFIHELLFEFFLFVGLNGVWFLVLALGAKLLPDRLVHAPLQPHVGFTLASVFLLLFCMAVVLDLIADLPARYLVVHYVVVAPFVTYPMILWHLAVTWGVRLSNGSEYSWFAAMQQTISRNRRPNEEGDRSSPPSMTCGPTVDSVDSTSTTCGPSVDSVDSTVSEKLSVIL